jgi:hypothetical protein
MRRRLEHSTELDKKDILHEPFDAMGWSSAWNFLEFWLSSRPVQTADGPSTTRVSVPLNVLYQLSAE